MSGGGAPKCRFPGGCNNRTWRPGGLCHEHIDAQVPPNQASPGNSGLHQPPPPTQDASHLEDDLRIVFPDIREPIDAQSIREQFIGVVRAAVSIDVYREFPKTNVANPEERRRMLSSYHDQLRGAIVPKSHLGEEERDKSLRGARTFAHSSVDEYGRALRDSAELGSYAMVKEREYALSHGIAYDEAGIAYDQPLDRYRAMQNERIQLIADDEFQRQLLRYPDIIEDVTGRPPVCPEPVVRTFDPQQSREQQPTVAAPMGAGYVQDQMQHEQVAQERREQIKEVGLSVVKGLGNVIRDTYAEGKQSRKEKKQQAQATHYRDKNPRDLTNRERYLLRQEEKAKREEEELKRMQYKYYKQHTRRGLFG